MRHYIDKASSLLDEIYDDKDVHIVEKRFNINRNKFCLIDISLNAHGQDQDKKYIRSAFYRANLRRGNTIIENQRQKTIEWARKGTPKILDIKLEYPKFFQQKLKLPKEDQNIAEIIFEGVNSAFKEGKKVQLVKTQKVNGENAQVSYNYDFDAWIICSKNVSILASSPQDLNKYGDSRYKYALLMADQWFKQIKNLKPEQIKNLKKLLDGYTIIGQYCGNPNYQHLVKYDQITIKWFAMVDNFSNQYCIYPFTAKKQLNQFGLKFAKIKSVLISSSRNSFFSSLQNLYIKTSEASLEDQQYGQQGSIVYFVVQQFTKKGEVNPRTVGAAKLKTLEYRFFRKMREKISRFIIKKQTPEQLLRKYDNEITELEKSNQSKAPFPHQYYIKILKAGIQLAESSQIKQETLRGRFVSFLKVIFYALYKKISLKKFGKNMFNDENFVQKVSQIPFLRYSGLGCSTKIIYIPLCLPGMFKSYLAKKISPHFQKLQIPYRIINTGKNIILSQQLQQICSAITEYSKQQSQPLLTHYYLDGNFDIQTLSATISAIKKSVVNSPKESFLKFILIKDQAKTESQCFCQEGNQYPFRLSTIIMNYYGQHQSCLHSPKLQNKVDNLKTVTQQLKRNRNFNLAMSGKQQLQIYSYPFSKYTKFPNEQVQKELQKIICNIVKISQDEQSAQKEKAQFNAYCSLILRLQKIDWIGYLEDEVDKEIEHLIKSSYPLIPKIAFKKQ